MSNVALVTGSSRGIGHEVARQLAQRGYRVIVTSRHADAAAKAAKKIGPQALAHVLDTSDPKSIEAIARFVEKEVGSLDVLVNNAAMLLDEGKNIVDVDPKEFEETWRVNTFGPFLLTRRLAPLLRKSGHGRAGRAAKRRAGGGHHRVACHSSRRRSDRLVFPRSQKDRLVRVQIRDYPACAASSARRRRVLQLLKKILTEKVSPRSERPSSAVSAQRSTNEGDELLNREVGILE